MRRLLFSRCLQTIAPILIGTVFAANVAIAQEASESMRGPDGRTTYHVAGIEVLPIADKPFFGKDSIVWSRKLEGGSTVTTQLYAVVARDSQGRIYRERRSFVPAGSEKEPKLQEVMVYDPTAKTKTTCVLATRECNITSYHPPMSFRSRPAGPFANGTMTLTRENLGTNVLDDLSVTGTRETTYVSAGVMGNDRPLVSTREFWYSAELETNLAVTREEPTEGTQVIKLIDLSRSEPEATLFEIPSGFTMHDLRHPTLQTTN